MSQKSTVMQREIMIISRHRALMISKYYLTIVLSIISIYLAIKCLAVSSLYVLITLNALPPIFSYGLNDYAKKHNNTLVNKIIYESSFSLILLKQKYKYTRLYYMSNSITYYITILLILLWQINYSYSNYIDYYSRYLPSYVIISGLSLRILLIIIYRIKLHFDLVNNRV